MKRLLRIFFRLSSTALNLIWKNISVIAPSLFCLPISYLAIEDLIGNHTLSSGYRDLVYALIGYALIAFPIVIAILALSRARFKQIKKLESWEKSLAIYLAIFAALFKPISDKRTADFQDKITKNIEITLNRAQKTDTDVIKVLDRTSSLLANSDLIIKKYGDLKYNSDLLARFGMNTEYPLSPASVRISYGVTYSKAEFAKICPTSLKYLVASQYNIHNLPQFAFNDLDDVSKNFIAGIGPILLWFEKDTSQKIENSTELIQNSVRKGLEFNYTNWGCGQTNDSITFGFLGESNEFALNDEIKNSVFQSIPDLMGKYFKLDIPMRSNYARIRLYDLTYITKKYNIHFTCKYVGHRPPFLGDPHVSFIEKITSDVIGLKPFGN